MKFKVGDKVIFVRKTLGYSYSEIIGREYTISKIEDCKYHWKGGNGNFFFEYDIELVNKNMNIKERFITAFLSEPEKSFRKVGITNGDGFLTEDGQSMFLSWLLKEQGAKFKKEVVDDLLKEVKEDK